MDDIQKKHSAIWSYQEKENSNVFSFSPKDLNHLTKIYQKYAIQPETLDKVCVEFLLQKEKLARYIIKELDTLLKTNGIFEVIITNSRAHSSYTRSSDQVKYEISVATNGRYQLAQEETLHQNKILRLKYIKITSMLPKNDTIDKWSFGIITNGKKQASIEKLILSIIKQKIPHYEIIICGPYENTNYHENVTVISDVIINGDIRAPIATKKNNLIKTAKHNNICILHDRFQLSEQWYFQFKKYGNYFDFLCLPTLDERGTRFNVDWMTFCYPITKRYQKNPSKSYSHWSEEQIIQGGVILGKKHLIEKNFLDERLHWRELEDIQFSKTAYLNGGFITTDTMNYFISESINHKPTRSSNNLLPKIFHHYLSWFFGLYRNKKYFYKAIMLYNKGKGLC